MAAAELTQPGVEVIQSFESVSPTILTPTLVPCVVAPFFEVIEVLESSGTLNSDAKLEDLYDQFETTISQSSFPSPRGNIDEVDVQEDSIRAFFDFGGSLSELSQEQAFLATMNLAEARPYVMGTGSPAGFDIDGRTLIFQLDSHTAVPATAGNLPTSADLTVTFAATTAGGTLTAEEVIAQINAVVPGVALDGQSATGLLGDAGKIALRSTRYGAHSSVVVRGTGTANGVSDGLGFNTTEPEISIGAGFYAADDADGDALSPRIEFYNGTGQKLLSGAEVPIVATFSFGDYSIMAGDTLYADGVDIGEVSIASNTRLTMDIEQSLLSSGSPFAPRRVWVRANDLTYPAPAASTAASQTGTVQTSSATQAYVVGNVNETTFNAAGVGASESIVVDVIDEDGSHQETVSSGAGWADLDTMISGINGAASYFEAYRANDVGDELPVGSAGGSTYLGLRTKASNKGSAASITVSSSTVATDIGFPTPPYSDVGENIRYLPGSLAWQIQGGSATPETWADGGGVTNAETIVYTPEVNGTAKAAETITWSAGHAGDSAGLAAAILDWNAQAIYTRAYEADSSGVGTSGGGYFAIHTRGENVGADASIDVTATDADTTLPVAKVTGADTDLNGKVFKWSLDNNPREFEVTFVADEDDGGTSLQHVINEINSETPGIAAEDDSSPPYLELESNKVGRDSEIEVLDGDSNTILGFSDDTSAVGSGRPNPDMALDLNGAVILQSQLLRDGLTGEPFNPGWAPIYIAYKGLRLDMSPDADNPGLLVIDTLDTLEEVADPISTDNPGALMLYLMLLNAPGVSVTAIGVPEVSADAPTGTPAGYASAAEFLENEEVYAISAATKASVVHQAFGTHVNFMSEPEQKGERIFFFCPETPDRDAPTLLASGTDANSTATENEITVDVNISPALIAAGIDPNEDINPTSGAIENEVYLDLGTDDKYYLIQKVTAGTTVTLRTSFSTGDGNSDNFFSNTELPSGIISDDWTVAIRGDELVITGSTKPDRNAIAETVQARGLAYGDRRMYYVFPDQCGLNITGTEQIVDGFYATACIAGMVGQLPPQQGFTNYPITGLTRVVGSNDMFTNRQMNVMAGGGIYILIQPAQGAPVSARHQLSTNINSIETRELSITKDVDYCAKFYRVGMRNYIGRSNITQPFLDNLSTIVAGLNSFLVDNGVLIGADTNNVLQDEDNPDTILLDNTLDVPYPCNYIRLTLVI